ncbi:hypothetical protein JSR06_00020 [Candidatus Vidania fulgoroideae]|uniref:Uncharacterized protein n=1 Tax=Candidatus Vidania fulgoroideorum TaxID=881286 RepID=A0A974XAH1_9PROT|nr:hypothetical protein JSR06_00020 [Candidatus Vidania fulgoroideae]
MIYKISEISSLFSIYKYKSVISYSCVDSNLVQKIRLLCFPNSKLYFLKNNFINRLLKNIIPSFKSKGNNLIFLTNDFMLIKRLFLVNHKKFSIKTLLSNSTNLNKDLINSLLSYSNKNEIYSKLCFLLRNKIIYLVLLLRNLYSVSRRNI